MSESSFAAAQQRILAQQVARQQQAREIQAANVAEFAESPLNRLPYPFQNAAPKLASFWTILLDSEGTRPSFRVGQVDAELLDEDLLGLLRTQVGEALKYLGPNLQEDWTQEISLFLRAALFKLSVWDNNASYGASLQNLRFTDARMGKAAYSEPTSLQKATYGLLTVFGRYIWDKWENWLIEQEGGFTEPSKTVQRFSDLTRRITSTYNVAAFLSFVIFLVNGRYRTLADRLLRLRLVSASSHVSRNLSFEYLNRQLVWHAFTEFLLFLLPLVGIGRWRRWLSRAWRRTKAAMRAEADEDDVLAKGKAGPLAFLPERTCAICYQDQNPTSTSEAEILGANVGAGGGVIGSASTDIVNPYETIPCGCLYCFVCLAGKIEAEEGNGWGCLRCGELIYKCRPWNGDVVVDKKPREKTGKAVDFKVEPGTPSRIQVRDSSATVNDWVMPDIGEKIS